eukprot:2821663-Pleurochrysis_carterae.AAC.1
MSETTPSEGVPPKQLPGPTRATDWWGKSRKRRVKDVSSTTLNSGGRVSHGQRPDQPSTEDEGGKPPSAHQAKSKSRSTRTATHGNLNATN